jgi:hypothetical protein
MRDSIKIDNHNLVLPLWKLMEMLSEDDKLEVADYISCENSVIKNVADQIVEGYTESGSYGSKGYDPITKYPSPLEKARRQVANNASEVARYEIDRLTSYIEMQKEYLTDQYRHKAENEQLRWRVKILVDLLTQAKELIPNFGDNNELIECIDGVLR